MQFLKDFHKPNWLGQGNHMAWLEDQMSIQVNLLQSTRIRLWYHMSICNMKFKITSLLANGNVKFHTQRSLLQCWGPLPEIYRIIRECKYITEWMMQISRKKKEMLIPVKWHQDPCTIPWHPHLYRSHKEHEICPCSTQYLSTTIQWGKISVISAAKPSLTMRNFVKLLV